MDTLQEQKYAAVRHRCSYVQALTAKKLIFST